MKVIIKGFTLVELLATVIVIGIVLLIAVPSVIQIINEVNDNVFIDNAIVAAKEVENSIAKGFYKGTTKLPENGENMIVSFSDINNRKLEKYQGNVTVVNRNALFYYYVSMSDGTRTICGIDSVDMKISDINNNEECNFDIPNVIVDNDNKEPEQPIEPEVPEEPQEPDVPVEPERPVITGTVNKPVLASGMTPIKWSDSTIVTTTVNDPDWYSYTSTDRKWANAKTADGSIWVWIPRYSYQMIRGYHEDVAGLFAIKFLYSTTNYAYEDESTAAEINQGNNPGSNSKYVTHPAFKFGDEELEGIWIMKFEASNNGGAVASVPNVTSWRSISPSIMFNNSRSMETNSSYGWGTSGNGIDTHLLKDVEWGAATYLAWSEYGIYGKIFDDNLEIWLNNSNTYITGCAGSSVRASEYSGCENVYNSTNGANASTTGNYYGIYDMSGGANDVTAAYLNGGGTDLSTYGASLLSANSKYKDVYDGTSSDDQDFYSLNSKYYGNAVYETSLYGSNRYSWNNDYSSFISSINPFTTRGGNYSSKAYAGIFAFSSFPGYSFSGASAYSYYGFRASLVIKEGL